VPEINTKLTFQPITSEQSGIKVVKQKSPKKIIFLILATISALLIGVIVGSFFWYNEQIKPLNSSDTKLKIINVESGSTPGQVSRMLEDEGIIRSALVFDIYVKLSGKQDLLQAGTYRLTPSESVAQVVEHLLSGTVDQFSVTFYPGATLTDFFPNSSSKKYDVTTALKTAGYSDNEISQALAASYNSPVLDGKPLLADLEGYVYGQTYNLNTGTSAEAAIQRALDEFYSVVKDNGLIKKFKAHGLSLRQGIILASIIQSEASDPIEQKQVAQVFYSRLALGMMLGSDVTYQYIADKTGVARDTNLDSPYNTRRYTGLPPGPISVPGLSALMAVADPASGDYLFFLSGDDDKMYYAKTDAEHQANIVNHCLVKCSTP